MVEMLYGGMFLAAAIVLALYARMRSTCDGRCGSHMPDAACSEQEVQEADVCMAHVAKLLTAALGLLVCGFTLRGIVRYTRRRAKAAEREKAQ